MEGMARESFDLNSPTTDPDGLINVTVMTKTFSPDMPYL